MLGDATRSAREHSARLQLEEGRRSWLAPQPEPVQHSLSSGEPSSAVLSTRMQPGAAWAHKRN